MYWFADVQYDTVLSTREYPTSTRDYIHIHVYEKWRKTFLKQWLNGHFIHFWYGFQIQFWSNYWTQFSSNFFSLFTSSTSTSSLVFRQNRIEFNQSTTRKTKENSSHLSRVWIKLWFHVLNNFRRYTEIRICSCLLLHFFFPLLGIISFEWLDFYGRRKYFLPRFVGCVTIGNTHAKKEAVPDIHLWAFFTTKRMYRLSRDRNSYREKIKIIIMKSFDMKFIPSEHHEHLYTIAASNELSKRNNQNIGAESRSNTKWFR